MRDGRSARATGGEARPIPGSQRFDAAFVTMGMNGLARWILRAQDCDAIVRARRHNYQALVDALRPLVPEPLRELALGICPLFLPLRLPAKAAALAALRAEGIEALDFWTMRPDLVPPGAFPDADELRRTIVGLPCHQDLAGPDIDAMIAAVQGLDLR